MTAPMKPGPAVTLVGILSLSACAVAPPTGPDVMVMPAQGKSFAEFQQDDTSCRQYASLLFGSAAGSNDARASGASLQHRYDASYVQCMAAKGESVPTMPASVAAADPYGPYRYAYPAYPGYYYAPPVVGSVVVGGRFHGRW
jgi:hypothetical protein